jgi:hypothetical protein
MSKQRIIKDEIWDDDWFYELDPSEKLVWVFLLTNPRGNIVGIYKLNKKWASQATGLDSDVFKTILARFVKDKKILDVDNWIGLVNFHKHLAYRNASVAQGIVRMYRERTGCPQALDSLWVTLLNSTLLYLSDSEDKSSQLRKEIKEILMGWNTKSDDYEEGVVDLDGDISLKEEKKVNTKKYPNAPAVRKVFLKVLGLSPANWKVNKTQLQSCENLYTERTLEKVESALVFYKEHEDDEYCPKISSPFDLDSKWTKLGEYKLKIEK